MPKAQKPMHAPGLRLVDWHSERRSLFRARRISMQTADGRTVSLIHWNPRERCWQDHRNKFRFRRKGSELHFCRLKRSGNLEEIPYTMCFLQEAVGKNNYLAIKRREGLKGKTIRLNTIGMTDKSQKLGRGGKRRGVVPAFLDYLKQRNAAKAVVIVTNKKLKKYYKSLGFTYNRKEDWYEMELEKWHWPLGSWKNA